MQRRRFMESAGASTIVMLTGLPERQGAPAVESPAAGWRTFEVTTRLEITEPAGATRAWVPLPLMADTDYQKRMGDTWEGNGAETRLWRDDRYDAGVLCAEWPAAVKAPVLQVVSRIATRDRAVDLTGPSPRAATESAATLRTCLEPTRLIPTDGIVLKTSREITQGRNTDLEKARAIYEWIVENTFRDPKVRGCGRGDIRTMLETRYLGGKSRRRAGPSTMPWCRRRAASSSAPGR